MLLFHEPYPYQEGRRKALVGIATGRHDPLHCPDKVIAWTPFRRYEVLLTVLHGPSVQLSMPKLHHRSV